MPHAVFGIAARVSGGLCGAPCRAVPWAVVGGGGCGSGAPLVSPPCPRRWPQRVRPWPPPLPVPWPCVRGPSRGPAPAPRWRSRPPFCPVGAARAEAESRAGLRPGDACPGGGPRDAAASPAAARFPPGCGRAALRAPSPRCRGGVWFSAGVFVGWRRAAPSAGPGPGPRRERGARGTCGGEGRVCRVGGKGPAVGGDRRAWTPPRPRPLLPSLPRPAPLAAVPPPGVVVRRRVPRPGPAQTPVPPPPSAFQPRQGSRLCRRPVLPPARPLFRRPSRVRTLTFPVPPPPPGSLPSRALSLPSPSLPPSRRVWRRGGCWCVAGRGGRRLWGGGGSGVVFGVLRRWVSAGEPGGLRSAASSRGRRSGPLVAPPPWPRGAPPGARARASLRDATSDQTWRPAEFKHISQRRKRN